MVKIKKGKEMSDLISRKAAIDMFQRLADDDWDKTTPTTWRNAYADAVEMVRDLQSAEHIKCENCVHYQTDWNPTIQGRHYCAVMDSLMKT